MTNYPLQIDTTVNLPNVVDNSTQVKADVVNRLRDAILAIESELGVRPSGIYLTIRNRVDTLENVVSDILVNGTGGSGGSGGVTFSGDLIGTAIAQGVVGLQGHPIAANAPLTNQFLRWNGSSWMPTTLAILDTDVAVSAAIAGTKISPNFGAQNIITTGNITINSINVGTAPATISSGSGTPSATQQNGSIFLRTNGDPSTAIYTYQSGSWSPITAAPTGTAGGDLSGTYPNPTVAKINDATIPLAGTLTTGNVLQVSGISSLTYAALNISGGANYVTGTLPIANGGTGVSQGWSVPNITNITANYTALLSDVLISVGIISSPITITLPLSPTTRQIFIIKDNLGNAFTNNITVNGNGFNIDNNSTYLIDQSYACLTIIFNGTNWSVV